MGDKVVIDDPDIGNAPFFDIATPFVAGSAIITTATSTVGAVSEGFLKSLLTIDQTTGDVSFDRLDFNFLDDGQTATFMIEVMSKSGPDSKKVLIPVTVTGANDEPTIVVGAGTVVAGGVTEDSVALTAALEADGVITFRDADLTDAHTATVALTSTASTLPGFVTNTSELGTFTIDPIVTENIADADNTGSVGWHFTLPDNNSILQSLAVGQTITQVYTITIVDDNSVPVTQAVTITITGTNDSPVLSADTVLFHQAEEVLNTTNSSVEDVVSGSLTFADVDLIDTHQASAALHPGTGSVVWSGGSFSGIPQATRDALVTAMTASVTENNTDNNNEGSVGWTFKLPDNLFDFLADGESLTLIYDVTVTDNSGISSTQQVTVQVGAANDQPIISVIGSELSGSVQEDASPILLTDSGTVTFTDTDLTDTHTVEATYNGDAVNSNGAVVSPALALALATALTVPTTTLAANDLDFDWNFSLANSLVQYLAAGETITFSYAITVKDNSVASDDTSTPQTVTVTITGTNDTPVMTADTSGTGGTNVHDLLETNSGLITSGTLAVTDADVTNTVAASVLDVTVGGTGASALPGALDNAALKAMFSVDSGNVIDNTHTTGTINWGFNSGAEAFNFLAAGETLVLTYTVRATDSDTTNATADTTVIVTITGTNDVPVFGGDIAKSVTEDTDLTGTDLVTSGTLTIADADHDQSSFAATPVGGAAGSNGYGTFTLNSSGNWTYTADNNQSVIQQLAVGQTLTDTYEAVSADGTHQTITVTINGTNDAPTVAAALTLSTVEGNAPVVRDLLAGASDIDNGETATLTVENISYLVDGLPANMPVGVTIFPDAGTIKINVDAANPAFDHIAAGETQTIIVSYDVTDAHLATVAQTETITITGVNDQPVLATGVDLSTITENETANSGQLVSSFATGISDADDDAVQGVAITGYTNQNGHWEYSINNGTNWTQFGLYSTAAGLLLSSDDKVRFVPDALNGGTDTLTYVAWDQTTGTHGQTANTPSGLQSDAFSQGSQTATLSVTDVNDAAVIGDPSMAEVREGDSAGNLVASGTLSISDVDSPEFFNPAVTDATGYTNLGTLSLQTDGQYAYSVANSNASVQALSGTQTHVDVFTIQSQDGTTKDVSFTINGVTEIASMSVANEALFATIGRDNFVFTSAFGDDTVTGFDFGGNDIIQFDTSMFASLQDILDQTADVSGNAVITASANDTITLIGVTKAQLQQTDFHLV
ncbi:MAG: VCBS domain-containing protein [Pseudomonadota bacterium]